MGRGRKSKLGRTENVTMVAFRPCLEERRAYEQAAAGMGVTVNEMARQTMNGAAGYVPRATVASDSDNGIRRELTVVYDEGGG